MSRGRSVQVTSLMPEDLITKLDDIKFQGKQDYGPAGKIIRSRIKYNKIELQLGTEFDPEQPEKMEYVRTAWPMKVAKNMEEQNQQNQWMQHYPPPGMPGMPGMSKMPGMSGMPGMPGMSGMPGMPGMYDYSKFQPTAGDNSNQDAIDDSSSAEQKYNLDVVLNPGSNNMKAIEGLIRRSKQELMQRSKELFNRDSVSEEFLEGCFSSPIKVNDNTGDSSLCYIKAYKNSAKIYTWDENNVCKKSPTFAIDKDAHLIITIEFVGVRVGGGKWGLVFVLKGAVVFGGVSAPEFNFHISTKYTLENDSNGSDSKGDSANGESSSSSLKRTRDADDDDGLDHKRVKTEEPEINVLPGSVVESKDSVAAAVL